MGNDNLLVSQYLLYLALSLTATVWVGRTLFKNGAAFLSESFPGKERLADSVNHLLVVGFYLVNAGWVIRTLKANAIPYTSAAVMENIAADFGTVLLVLGGMHLFNLYVLTRIRRRGIADRRSGPVSLAQ
jgi:hypothetical protein